MAFIKYSVGTVSSAIDNDGASSFEDKDVPTLKAIAVCKTCGTQYAASNETYIDCSCGSKIELQNN